MSSKTKGLRWLVLRAILVGACFALPPVLPSWAEQDLPGFGRPYIVRLDSDGITPRELKVEAGGTVVWLNSTQGYVGVVFIQGRQLTLATKAPTRFFLAPDGTFTSNPFAPGGVASLAFVERGRYSYFVTGLNIETGAAFGIITAQ